MTEQHAATILTPIADGQVASLTALLESIGSDVNANPHIPFAQLRTAHFLSWFIVERDGFGPYLFLELNVDGTVEAFLHDLVAKAGPGVDKIYEHCKGYPADGAKNAQAVVDYLRLGDAGFNTYYIAWRGLSVERILEERTLRERIENYLDSTASSSSSATEEPRSIQKRIQEFVLSDPSLAWAREVPPRPFVVQHRGLVVALLVGLLGAGSFAIVATILLTFGPWPIVIFIGTLLAAVALLVWRLRWLEDHDFVQEAQTGHSHVREVTQRENRIVQNHFASIAVNKSGILRLLILKSVLWLINFVGAIYYNQGRLGGIPSIHFARWVILDRGRRLLFLSNYDGSWENYLDDFIDQESGGLSAIWSNTYGFPRTRFLVFGGAEDEIRFKSKARLSQVPSLVWYSAYPDLTVQNIASNAAIREGLFVRMNNVELTSWLRLF